MMTMLCPCPLMLLKRESDQKSLRLIKLLALVLSTVGIELVGLFWGDSSSRIVTLALP